MLGTVGVIGSVSVGVVVAGVIGVPDVGYKPEPPVVVEGVVVCALAIYVAEKNIPAARIIIFFIFLCFLVLSICKKMMPGEITQNARKRVKNALFYRG